MNGSGFHQQKRYKKPKRKTQKTTNPGSSKAKRNTSDLGDSEFAEPVLPLAAKDSGWVDVVQMPRPVEIEPSMNITDEEEVLQLVECEDDIQIKPLVLMFPGLLEKDPQTLQGILHRAMSTTEVTRQLVNLRQKADFTFMKKSNRLIPRDKQWLEKVVEDTDSVTATNNDKVYTTEFDGDSCASDQCFSEQKLTLRESNSINTLITHTEEKEKETT